MAVAQVVPPARILTFIAGAMPGAKLVYAVGTFLPVAWAAPGLGQLRTAYNQGDIELVQRRRGDGDLEYIAIRRATRARLEHGFGFPRSMCA